MLEVLWNRDWSLDGLTPPWGTLPSIYEEICKNQELDPLPDDALFSAKGRIRFSKGASDGAWGHHGNPSKEEDRVQQVVRALKCLLRAATDSNLRSLYDLVVQGGILGIADGVVDQVLAQIPTEHSRLARIARHFSTRAGHREAVKFGIVLLGAAGAPEDTAVLMKLGGHDEFSLFAAVALSRLDENAEQRLWELAQRVRGWGRIQIVERLAHTCDPEIQKWLLREGFRNSVTNEYLACVCARAGKLHDALNSPLVDGPLLDAAADILHALINGGPAEGIDDYEHAPEAAEAYVKHLWAKRAVEFKHFLTVDALLRYLGNSEKQEARRKRGWSEERETNVNLLGQDIVSWEAWSGLAQQGLSANDPRIFHNADQVAQALGISTRDVHFARVRSDPINSNSWFELLRQTRDDGIDEVITYAESVLPLAQIASVPEEELGLGPGFEPHHALGWVLQDLRRFPGHGWNLIRTGLRSPVVRNRNMALKAFAKWAGEQWPPDAITALRDARDIEPNSKTKLLIEEILARKP
jgi:hypothetical protein